MNSIFPPKPVSTVAPKVGDFMCGSYGYEACIHHVAIVVAVTGASVKLQEVQLDSKYKQGGMEWTSTITAGRGPTVTKRWKSQDKSYRVKWHESMTMWGPWTPCELSGYNYH